MKYNHLSILALLMIVMLSSCSDFLDEKLQSQLAPDNTFASTQGFESTSAGLYAIARSYADVEHGYCEVDLEVGFFSHQCRQ